MAILEIEITDELQGRLERAADREGVSFPAFVNRKLDEAAPVSAPRNMLEYLEGYLGTGTGGGIISSENTGAQFADILEEKRWNGRI